jgi:mRNA interferase HigB
LHVISRRKLLEARDRHSDLIDPLDVWYRIAKKAAWKNLVEVRRQLPTADIVGKYFVFNIKGNAYRLIAEVFFASQVILVRHVLTHAEYDKGGWK